MQRKSSILFCLQSEHLDTVFISGRQVLIWGCQFRANTCICVESAVLLVSTTVFTLTNLEISVCQVYAWEKWTVSPGSERRKSLKAISRSLGTEIRDSIIHDKERTEVWATLETEPSSLQNFAQVWQTSPVNNLCYLQSLCCGSSALPR